MRMAEKHIWENENSLVPSGDLWPHQTAGGERDVLASCLWSSRSSMGKRGGFGSFGFPYYTGGRKRRCCWRAGFAGKVLVWRHFGLRSRGSSRSCRYFTAVRVFSYIRSSLGKSRGRLCNKGRVSKTAALNLQQRCWPQVSISYRVIREANLGFNRE